MSTLWVSAALADLACKLRRQTTFWCVFCGPASTWHSLISAKWGLGFSQLLGGPAFVLAPIPRSASSNPPDSWFIYKTLIIKDPIFWWSQKPKLDMNNQQKMARNKNLLESFTTGIVVLRAGYVLLMVWVFVFGPATTCPDVPNFFRFISNYIF